MLNFIDGKPNAELRIVGMKNIKKMSDYVGEYTNIYAAELPTKISANSKPCLVS